MNISLIKWHGLILILAVAFVPSAYAQNYFDSLAARPDVVQALAFRSLEQIAEHWSPNNHDDVSYDPVEDAMRFTWPSVAGNNNDAVKVLVADPGISSGNVFVTWEEKWSSNWVAEGDRAPVNGISTHKNYQYAKERSSRGTEIRLWHRKTLIDQATMPAGKLGSVDIRAYFGTEGGAKGGAGGSQAFRGQRLDVILDADVWIRYFMFVEYGGPGKVSLWVTQPGLAPAAVYLQAPGENSGDPGRFGSFWFEHDSSDFYSGPTSYVWNRDFVVLNGVADLAEAQALVAQGSLGGPPPVRPKAPDWIPDT